MKLTTPKFLAKQPIVIEFYDSKTDENGESITLSQIEVMCRYQQSDETSYLPNGKKVKLVAKAFVFDKLDEFPEKIIGKVTVGTDSHEIFKGERFKNPDGSANHIVLEMI